MHFVSDLSKSHVSLLAAPYRNNCTFIKTLAVKCSNPAWDLASLLITL